MEVHLFLPGLNAILALIGIAGTQVAGHMSMLTKLYEDCITMLVLHIKDTAGKLRQDIVSTDICSTVVSVSSVRIISSYGCARSEPLVPHLNAGCMNNNLYFEST